MPGCKGECFVYVWNALALLLFACIHWAARRLCRAPAARRNRILKTLCALLLGGNLFRYCVFHPLIQGTVRIPVEFSTVAYFAAPALLLRRKPRLRSWAAYSGLMAGFFYYMAMILAGGSLYAADAPLEVLISLLCHGTLYFCGFVVVRTESFRPEEASRLGLGVATVALRAAALRPVAECGQRLLIYLLLDAPWLRPLLPERLLPLALPAYYAAMAALVYGSIQGFFRLNQRQLRPLAAPRPAEFESMGGLLHAQ